MTEVNHDNNPHFLLPLLNESVDVMHGGRWRRVTFYAEPLDESHPKSLPDYESAGAVWATLEEVLRGRHPMSEKSRTRTSDPAVLRLRANEPLQWFPLVANGLEIPPLAIPPEHAAMFSDIPF